MNGSEGNSDRVCDLFLVKFHVSNVKMDKWLLR